MSAVSDQDSQRSAKTPVEQAVEHAVDVFVYAPIGLLFEGASLLPQLIEKGKSQVTMARMIGQFAVTQGQTEAEKLAAKLQDQAIEVLARIGGSSTAPPAPVVPSPPAPSSEPAAAAGPPPSVAESPVVDEASHADHAAGSAIDAGSLAIPDYDGLSASHVVNRLAGLAPAELEAVRLYEMANRGRKTILSKVAQLQAG
jgi:hypothetical protein